MVWSLLLTGSLRLSQLLHELSILRSLHHWELVHLLDSHTLAHEPNSVLEGKKLLISHDVWVNLFAKQMSSLVSNIKLIHPSIVN